MLNCLIICIHKHLTWYSSLKHFKNSDYLLKQHEEEIKIKKKKMTYIDGNFEKQEAKVSFNLCISIENNNTSSQILNQIKNILYNLKTI